MVIIRVVLLSIICVFNSVAAEQLVDSMPIVNLDFESRNLQSMNGGIKAEFPKASSAITVNCTVARTGSCSGMTSVSNDDDHIIAGAHRAEFDTSSSSDTFYTEKSKWIYQFSLMLNKNWTEDSKDFIDIVWQFKRFGNYPDGFVAVKGKALVLRIIDRRQIVLVDEFPKNQWVDIKLTVNWSTTDQGGMFVEVREQGSEKVKTFEDAGPNMRVSNGLGGYVKWGLYKPGNDHEFAPRSVHHDDIKIFRLN